MNFEQELYRLASAVRPKVPSHVGFSIGVEDAFPLNDTVAVAVSVSWWLNEEDYGETHKVTSIGSSLTDGLTQINPKSIVKLLIERIEKAASVAVSAGSESRQYREAKRFAAKIDKYFPDDRSAS